VRKGQREVLEAERADRIQVKRERREDIRKIWKEVQFAGAKADKVLALKYGEDFIRQLKDEESGITKAWAPSAIEDGRVEPNDTTEKVDFDQEDDDPFGGCEVTTTTLETRNEPTKLEDAFKKPRDALQIELPGKIKAADGSTLTLSWRGVYESEEQRLARRTKSLRKQENIRTTSLKKRVLSSIAERKKMKKQSTKHKPPKRRKKGRANRRKVGAKERRMRTG